VDFRSLFGLRKPKQREAEEAPPKPGSPTTQERSAPESLASRTSPDLALLAKVGEPDGPSPADAMRLFRALRTTPEEGRAIAVIVEKSERGRAPEELVIAGAAALADRGEPDAGLRTLARLTSSAALLLGADLLAERGELAPALARTERVLLRDFDHPGARERHRRWREALGLRDESKRHDVASAVTVVASEPDSPFRLLREVARGGAGAVYEAEDRDLGRRVALKVYHHPERDRAQLTHEARVAAELAGPGIVRVFDVDPDHGWLALEWAPLGALRDHIRRHDKAALSPMERWALPLALALARAHAAGWVHHDVKPANVLLRSAGAPLVSDFGTARRLGEPSPPGSLGYVSPERMRGRASDPRDDVYGFGRIVEDVLDTLGDKELAARWHPLAAACTGSDEGRPADARALVTRLRVETA